MLDGNFPNFLMLAMLDFKLQALIQMVTLIILSSFSEIYLRLKFKGVR